MAKLRVDIGVQDRTPSPLGATERQRAIEREEHAADVIRFRQAATMGIVAWLGFCLVDVVVDRELHVGRAGYFAALRMIELLILIPAILIVRRQPPPSRGLLRAMDLAGFTVATAIVSVMCLSLGGLSSHYGAGVSLVLVCRTIMSNEPWRRGLVMNGVPALSYPAVLLGAAPFDPRIAAQLHDPRETTIFGLNLTFLLATYASMVFSGHMTWSLRRQIFETRSIGKYKLKQRLGQGAMGEVWLAYHASIKRDVAIKILRPDTSKDVGAVSRFEREVRATAELTHPNTVRVFDYGVTEDGLWYYAMEALVGETLGALVAREGPLPPARAVHFVGQAARALAEAHALGIIHRDIKPENLFVASLGGESDFLKVLDFGIARVAQGDLDATVTSTGWMLGTPAYVSPEVASGNRADARSDVYALGAVLYFLLCGHPPFENTNAGALLYSHMNERPKPPSAKLGRPLPEDVERVVARCLEKDPEVRFASAARLSVALAACNAAGGWSVARMPIEREEAPPRSTTSVGDTLVAPPGGPWQPPGP